jgi:hypothetical protein
MSIQRAAVSVVCGLAAFCCASPAALGATANWNTSDLDLFVYGNASDPGLRALAPSYANLLQVDETQQFVPHTLQDPSRLGNALFAYNTASQIASGRAASRYVVHSVTFTASFTYEGSPKKVQYDDQPITQTELLEQYNGTTTLTAQRPMELYGVGFCAGYTGYEFGTNVSGPPLLDEVTHPYSPPDYGYSAFPIVREEIAAGVFADVDVMNSVTGGYSETETTHTTSPFTPTPWAIGTTNLAPGTDIPNNTTFTFSLDLNLPGVRSYVQQSLSNGGLGVFLSSLHSTGVMGAGGGYPRWYTKESADFPYNVPPQYWPKLNIVYDVLPPVAGDYDDNGVVDAADYILWRNGGPLANQVHDPSQVNQQDFIEWRARFGNTISGAGSDLSSGGSIPEPAAIVPMLTASLLAACRRFGRNRIC